MTQYVWKIVRCPLCGKPCLRTDAASGNTFGGIFWTDGYVEAPMLDESPWISKCPACKKIYWDDMNVDSDVVTVMDEEWMIREIFTADFIVSDDDDRLKKLKQKLGQYPRVIKSFSEKDYFSCIAKGLARTKEEELYLRIMAWRESNHAFRPLAAVAMRNPMKVSWTGPVGMGERQEYPRSRFYNQLNVTVPTISRNHGYSDRKHNMEMILDLLDGEDKGQLFLEAEVLRELARFDESLAILERIPAEADQRRKAFMARCNLEKDAYVKIYCDAGAGEE